MSVEQLQGWVESHCHLDALEDPHGAVARAADMGVTRIVAIGDDLATSRAAIALAHEHPNVVATAGIHPHVASQHVHEWPGILECQDDPQVVAVGETGLDYFYQHSTREEQIRNLVAHIELAVARDRALVLHVRDAWDDFWSIIDDHDMPSRAVIHCCTGGPAEVERAVARDLYIGISGIVTFKNASDIRSAVPMIPEDRLLIETDSPFLAPVPHRGKKNEPAFLTHIGEALAALRSVSLASLAQTTAANAERFYCGPGGAWGRYAL